MHSGMVPPPQQLGSFSLGGIWLHRFTFVMFCLFLEGILNRNLLGFGVCADLQNLNSVHFPSAISESFQGFIVCFRWFVLMDAIWSVDANCLNCRRYLWVCLNFPNSVHFPSAVSLILSKTSTRFIFRRRHPFPAYAALSSSRASVDASVYNFQICYGVNFLSQG